MRRPSAGLLIAALSLLGAAAQAQPRPIPIIFDTEVTSSSRMASRGGLVTWAKSCLK